MYSKARSKVKAFDPLSIESLKKAELEHIEKAKGPIRHVSPSNVEARLKRIEFEESNSLARQDVSEFFKKNVPLSEPNLRLNYLLTWVALSVPDVLSFGFNDCKYRLSMSSEYFTYRGFYEFTQALRRSRLIEMVEVNQQKITVVPKGTPVLETSGIMGGLYQWRVQLPLVLTFRGGAKTSTTGLLVTVSVVRSDDPRHPYGIAIDKWVATTR